MECCCHLRNIEDLLSEDVLGKHFNFSIWSKGRISHLFLLKTYRLHQFCKKVLPGIFLGFVLHAGRIWKGDILISDIEESEKMDASEIHANRINAKEV